MAIPFRKQGGQQGFIGGSNQTTRSAPINQTPPIVGGGRPVPQSPPIRPVPQQFQQQQFQPQQAQTQQALPQFGLAGGEQALQAGLGANLAAQQAGTGSALNTLLQAGGLVDQSQQEALGQFQQAQGQGLSAIGSGISAGQAELSPFSQTGVQANQLQAALTGSLGPEAQAQAFADFQSSPEQAFLREQGELGIINQQAALGGLGGARVQRELSRFGTGLAAQDFQNAFNRQGVVADRGATAAGQSAQLAGQGAIAEGNLIGQLAGQELGARTQFGGILGDLASQGAGFQQQSGVQAGNTFGDVASQLANARIGAGQDIAKGIQGTTQGLSQLAQQQGSGVSDILGAGGANIANLLSGSGQLNAQQSEQLAALLANLSTGQATQVGGLTQQAGQAVANANLAATQGGQQLGADVIGGLLAAFSDERLKENITNIGNFNGINFYSWTWNDKIPIKELVGLRSEGVIAQELELTHPQLINEHDSGYKTVDYIGLSKLWQH